MGAVRRSRCRGCPSRLGAPPGVSESTHPVAVLPTAEGGAPGFVPGVRLLTEVGGSSRGPASQQQRDCFACVGAARGCLGWGSSAVGVCQSVRLLHWSQPREPPVSLALLLRLLLTPAVLPFVNLLTVRAPLLPSAGSVSSQRCSPSAFSLQVSILLPVCGLSSRLTLWCLCRKRSS